MFHGEPETNVGIIDLPVSPTVELYVLELNDS